MGYFEPRQETPFVTIKGTLNGPVAAGDGLESEAGGTWIRATGASGLMIGVAAADGVATDVISVYVEGVFRTTNDSGGALVVGDLCSLKDHTDVETGATGDRTMVVVGPLASNANAGTVDVAMTINSPLAL